MRTLRALLNCGFYPGSHPREHQSDTAATFDDARVDFERAWLVFLSKRTEADFQAWRDERDWTERKYALWDAVRRWSGQAMDRASPPIVFRRCPCGEVFDTHHPEACWCMCRTSPKLCQQFRVSRPANEARPRAGRKVTTGPCRPPNLEGMATRTITGSFRARSCDILTAPELPQHVSNESATRG